MHIEKIKLALACLLLALTASLLRFQTELQSDALFFDALLSDLLNHGGHWADWKLIRAPAFVPDMLLYLLAYPLWPDAASRIFFVSAAQVLILAASAVWCARQVSPHLSRAAQTALMLLVALTTLVAARSNMWLYFYSTNNHFVSLCGGLLALGLLLRHCANPRRGSAALLLLLLVAARVSSGVLTLTLVLPLAALLALALCAMARAAEGTQRQRRLAWSLAGLLLTAQVLALLLEKLLIVNEPVEGQPALGPDTAGRALTLFMRATAAAFSADNGWALGFALLLLAALLYLGLGLLRRVELDADGLRLRLREAGGALDWRCALAGALLCAALPIDLAGVVLSGGFVDLNAYRYFAFPLALALLLGVVALDRERRLQGRAGQAAALALALLVAAGAAQLLRQPPRERAGAAAVAACLNRVEAAGFALRAGVGDYWNGRAVSYALPRHNPMLVTLNDAMPLFWVGSIAPLTRPQNDPRQRYNFVLLRDAGAGGQFDYTAAAMGGRLPPPSAVHACPASALHVWWYAGDELDAAMRRNIALWLEQRRGRR